MATAPAIFDCAVIQDRRKRAPVDPIHHLAAGRLAERLEEITRSFADVLYFGAGELRSAKIHVLHVANEDVESFEYPENRFDLIGSSLRLHWVNDLPGTLLRMRRALMPDGLLLANFPGGETLRELRTSLTEAELELTHGVHPRLSPFIGLRDAGALLQRSGFSLPVADSETLTLTYPDAFALMRDLRKAGETNALSARPKRLTRRGLFQRASEIYHERFGLADGRIPATLELITLTAWKPHESQPQPLKRGSAQHSLATALKGGNNGNT